jgi:hypothetical protein
VCLRSCPHHPDIPPSQHDRSRFAVFVVVFVPVGIFAELVDLDLLDVRQGLVVLRVAEGGHQNSTNCTRRAALGAGSVDEWLAGERRGVGAGAQSGPGCHAGAGAGTSGGR